MEKKNKKNSRFDNRINCKFGCRGFNLSEPARNKTKTTRTNRLTVPVFAHFFVVVVLGMPMMSAAKLAKALTKIVIVPAGD